MAAGEPIYYDGLTARPRPVAVRFSADGIEILDPSGLLATWAYADLRRADAPVGAMRVRSLTAPELARLEIVDEALQAELRSRCHDLTDPDREGAGAAKVVFWSVAAAASLLLSAIYLVPLVADRLVPFIPPALEQRLGLAVDHQVQAIFGRKTCEEEAGKAALAKLSARLLEGAGAPAEASIAVLASPVPNAVALPGGRIYLFEGLLRRAESPDEVAGVLAHEIGHVAHRDGLRRLLQTGGTSFLLGLLFGDVTGSGAIILASRTILDGSYSRDAERGADAHAASVMVGLGRSPEPLGALLQRISGRADFVPPFLSSHPLTTERMQALGKAKPEREGPPLLSDEEWRALKSICKAA